MGILTNMLEKRSGVMNPQKWLQEFFGGRDSLSGAIVTETTALNSTAVYACIRLLADTLASLPLILYQRLEPRGKEKAFKNPLYKLLHDKANPYMTAFTWRETMMGHVLGWGNAYSQIIYSGGGYPVELWPLRPDMTRPKKIPGTRDIYYETVINGVTIPLPASEVLHIPGLGFDGMIGYSPITLAREAIGLSLATEEFGARFFGSGTHPGVIVTRPAGASDLSGEATDRLRKQLTDAQAGLGKAHRLMLLEEGMTIAQIGVSPEDSQFLQTRQFQLSEIARFFGVQEHLVGALDRATNNNIEYQGLEFVIYTMRPWFVRWEQTLNQKLIPENQQDTLFFEFLAEGLHRGDQKSRYDAYSIGRQWGWLSANDVREIENMNPIEGGDDYLAPMNMVPAGQGIAEPDPGNDIQQQNSLKIAWKRLFFDAVTRVVKREIADISRELKREGFDLWVERYFSEPQKYIETHLLPVIWGYFEALNGILTEWNMLKGREIIKKFTTEHQKCSLDEIKHADPEYVTELLKTWEFERIKKDVEALLKGVD